jgi:hypothetical protein
MDKMIVFISVISICSAFYWLMVETDWLRANLMPPKLIGSINEIIPIFVYTCLAYQMIIEMTRRNNGEI